ncbi:MAG: hypothetical protein J1F60_06870 [Oscillospiraceae bacterium]|nr:hypothetical protein [Oscillospiraceae bacterium]
MFEEFFENCEMQDSEKITAEQSDNIKASLREKIAADISQPNNSDKEKEKDIMKSKSIRTIIIAAAVAVVGLGAAVTASGDFLTRREIAADLAEKNRVTPEFEEYAGKLPPEIEGEVYIPEFYNDMEINELVVREYISAEFKGLFDEELPGIILDHLQKGGGVSAIIKQDADGNYLYDGEIITNEKLLAAIAEGTEKYGDTFVIMY